MYTVYKLNAQELDMRFINALKAMFTDRDIEIAVCESEPSEYDETEYLLSAPANREHLLNAMKRVEQQENLVVVDGEQFA
jgi:antitoxin YefM